ncbi:hypothetical protein PpBr36_02796 [Pyricularia pennisetigena]|uniref:hypothetical protein n=1 Tax=Pyricularia pennisetigena TaxID=1578925 RepID=UPI001153DD3D|nr:hypothetical protein PpBr36_02796 [Pyricularia pennisetigena]TLS30307.1 hypothetical protein PpBr36_02796 [Pyricularia pennisetigena]
MSVGYRSLCSPHAKYLGCLRTNQTDTNTSQTRHTHTLQNTSFVMTSPKFFTYSGFGQKLSDDANYSQSVRIGNEIKTSGQGGWDTQTGKISEKYEEELDQAFTNLDVALKDAGGKGLEQVYKVNMYLTLEMTEEVFGQTAAVIKNRFPNHRPLLTVVGVTTLAFPEMHVEIEVSAYDPQ